ncbi:MAG: hypothetical protein A3E01_09295 [Gammaproteobacteria bacterium RIFCSPHIGHO2_12_FULL_63_22]|nr:MAG: hypothetical protein A3E01_09295 [Gammaproteobacteria bacterium RIFCSPHIGHO2_12_FULL_63_22]
MVTILDARGNPIAPRSNVVRMHRDGLANLVSGAGTSRDRSIFDLWSFMAMDQQQLMAAYRSNWLVGKIVDIPAEDMVREWRNWQAEKDQIEKLEEAERKFGIVGKVQSALALSRLCGGAAILLGFGDVNPSMPRPSSIGLDALKYVHVFNRFELSLGEKNKDITSPWYGHPQYFRIASDYQSVPIHPSRMVVFPGAPVPNMGMTTWEDQFWGDSVIQRVDRAVKNAVKANDGFARLIDEAKIDVYRMAGFMEQLAANEATVRQRVEYTDAGKSSLRGVFLDKDDEFIQRQLTLTGMPEMIECLMAVVAGAADIPATRLLGRAPQGMNATGEGDEKNYHTMIRSKQRLYLAPTIDRIDDVLIPSVLGTDPASISYVWNSLAIISDKERAEIENMEADTVSKIVSTGLVPDPALSKAVQNRMIESQRWPGLEQAIEELPDMSFDPGSEDPSALTQPNGKEVDPTSPTAQGPSGSPAPARAANDAWLADASPRPLYVQRKILNAADLVDWAKANGFASTLAATDMHVTVLYSRAPVDPMKMGRDWSEDEKGRIIVRPGGPRAIERLGENAVVLRFVAPSLEYRHRDLIEAGGSHDYDEYRPHVTLSYTVPDDVDLDAIKPFNGELVFGPEIFEPLDLDWKVKVSEE